MNIETKDDQYVSKYINKFIDKFNIPFVNNTGDIVEDRDELVFMLKTDLIWLLRKYGANVNSDGINLSSLPLIYDYKENNG